MQTNSFLTQLNIIKTKQAQAPDLQVSAFAILTICFTVPVNVILVDHTYFLSAKYPYRLQCSRVNAGYTFRLFLGLVVFLKRVCSSWVMTKSHEFHVLLLEQGSRLY